MSHAKLGFLVLVFALACGGGEDDGPTVPDVTGSTSLTVSCDPVGGVATCSSSYNINGFADPGIELIRGQGYSFNVTVAADHPMSIKIARGLGSATFDDGVTGQDTATLNFMVPMSAPDELFYQCGIHSAMGGKFFITGP